MSKNGPKLNPMSGVSRLTIHHVLRAISSGFDREKAFVGSDSHFNFAGSDRNRQI